RVLETERVADRDHPLPDLQVVRVAEVHRRQIAGTVDLDQRDVGFRVAPDDLRLELLAPRQLDDYLVRILDDVVIGEYVAGRIDDEARAEALRLVRHPPLWPEESFERPEELVKGILFAAAGAAG